ncbi:hypothetical protein QBC33DRAFT_139 [Phialemonium atrogriseum]|uniref:Uncharacterized protein n=1 Tax=Phialemonium atrogriseum TaxID=1093897 RepID=A0AAJ0FLE8_9PEZI|nr:uncharacterized protein QBC33DRAFT_139 [Phialemonium atrogriseum]KAK1772107.1 hypothetical protein QBC33DRAFT_139 [Phialemonium atrogriseum]
MAQTNICDVDGNGDFYGLGIRVGFYSQWISTLLVNIFVREEAATSRTVNLLLQLAVLICVVFLTIRRAIYPHEVMIAFWLLVGGPWSMQWGAFNRSGTLVALSRLVLYAALSAYSCWFWFGGLDELPQTPCESFVFLGGATTHGWFRWFGKALSICGLAACVAVLGWGTVRHWKGKMHGSSASRVGRRSKSTVPEAPQTDIALLTVSVSAIVLSIISTEYLIRDNHLVGVDVLLQPGQLIPLIVGAFGLMEMGISLLSDGKLFKRQCLTFINHHFT